MSLLQETYERALLAQFPVIAEYARALMAEALCGLNSEEQPGYLSAALGLLATGHVSVQILWRFHGRVPWVNLRPPMSLLQCEAMDVEPTCIEMETLIAQGRYFQHTSKQRESRAHVQRIVTHLNTIATQLNATDRVLFVYIHGPFNFDSQCSE